MKINIFFIETKSDLSEEKKEMLRNVIYDNAKKALLLLKIDLLNIIVYPSAKGCVEETGTGGFAPNSDWIKININPLKNDKEINRIIKKIIPLVVFHELNHVARWMSVGYGNSLKEIVITEGLAIVFAEENWNFFDAPWGKYKNDEVKNYLNIFKKEVNKKSVYNHSEWFFGKGKPKWFGYKLGAYIIRKVRKLYPEIKINKLTNMTADEILNLAKIDI